MAIKIGGTTTIDDNSNVSGYIGTFTGLNTKVHPAIFSPSVGQTSVELNSNIILTFNQTVGISSTTANITIRQGSASGVAIATIGVGSTSVTISGAQVTIDPPINFTSLTTYFPVIDAGAFRNSFGNVSTALTTYSFTTRSPNSVSEVGLGGLYQGGYVICKSGGIAWIVAPASSQIVCNWYNRDQASTSAQACTGVSGWFIPTCGQLQNPGYSCRTYWDSYSQGFYWSSTGIDSLCSFAVCFVNNAACALGASTWVCIRAFRCVSY